MFCFNNSFCHFHTHRPPYNPQRPSSPPSPPLTGWKTVLPPEAPNQEWQALPRGDTNYVKQLVAATVAKVETEALCDLFEDALDIALVDMQEQMAPKAKRLSRRFAEQSEAEKALIAQAHEARLLAWEKQAMAEVSQSMAAAGAGELGPAPEVAPAPDLHLYLPPFLYLHLHFYTCTFRAACKSALVKLLNSAPHVISFRLVFSSYNSHAHVWRRHG